MSQRNCHDPGFSTDSFLDVLANMVGILIILIVIAGIRAARPPEQPRPDNSPAAEAETAPDEPDDVPAEPDPPASAPAEPQSAEPQSDEPPAELVRELSALDAELASLEKKHEQSLRDLKKVQALHTSARQEAAAAEEEAVQRKQDLAEQQSRVARLRHSLGERKEELTGLLAEFEESRHSRAPAIKVRHRLAPISQEVVGDEVHFRLIGNRVAVIPLDQLVERVKVQLERQKDWLARHSRHQGSVGPVDGFLMRYVVERQQLSPMEERKMGYGAFRVGVSSWELVAEKDAPAESLDEALRRGSRFAAALQAAPERAVLTFWVYPDSFGLYRKLQEASHAEGFVVAARPLPDGVPIAGSPHGTRSAGQ